MDQVEIENSDKARISRILPHDEKRQSHPYCDKTDSHWYAVMQRELGFGSGAFRVERDAEVWSYRWEDKHPFVEASLGRTDVFYFIDGTLITFCGVLEDTAYILSRPAELKDGKLVFPKSEKLKEDFFATEGPYFVIRPVNVEPSVMTNLVRYLKRK